MVVDYDPSHGMLYSAMRVRSTVVAMVLCRPEFYMFAFAHAAARYCYRQGMIDPESQHAQLSLKMTGVTGSLMTFFVVFYNGYVFKRYNSMYYLTKKLNEECLITASIIAREIPDVNIKRRLVRMLLASSGLFFFLRTPDDSHPSPTCSNVSKREWAQLEHLRLLHPQELKMLRKHDKAAGKSSMPSFLLLQWSMKLVRSVINRHNDLEKAYWRVRKCQEEVVELLELPMPFQYFHIMNLMYMLNLTLWAYSFALMDSYVATIIFVFIQTVFQGIRELSIQLSDPYGADDIDFPLNDWVRTLWLRVVAISEDTWDVNRATPVGLVDPLPFPRAGEQLIDIYPTEESKKRTSKDLVPKRRESPDGNGSYVELSQVEAGTLDVRNVMMTGLAHIADDFTEEEHEDAHVDHQAAKRIEEEITELTSQEAERSERLDEMTELWERRTKLIEKQIEGIRTQRDQLTFQLEELLNSEEGPPPPGPSYLRFLEHDSFHCLASVVIVANISTMVMEEVDHSYKKKFVILNHCYMVFYVLELLSKICLLHCGFFFGRFAVVAWNWLDLIIVGSGVIESYLKPLMVQMNMLDQPGHGGHSPLSFLRALRLFRVLKIIGLFLQADMSWTEGARFQLFIMGVIGFNSVLMGMESDIPDFFGWFYVEQLLLVIFSFEILVRMKMAGCKFFVHPDDWAWNWLDSIIVAGGVVDQWFMPTVSFVQKMMGRKATGSGHLGQFMMILRMARLLRILRLVRLVKSIPPLYTLIIGIIQAMQGMSWVLVLTALVLYAFALLGVKLIGHGLALGDDAPPEVQNVFPYVLQSMFVLFKSMNGDWEPLSPLFDYFPLTKAIFILFTVISTWAILSILTAVVSDNMINATNEHREEIEEEKKRQAMMRSRVKMYDLFKQVRDNDGTITESELDALLADEESAAELTDAVSLEPDDIKEVFQHLARPVASHNGGFEYTVSHKEFIEGLQHEKDPVVERSMMRLEREICQVRTVVANLAEEMRRMNDRDVHPTSRDASLALIR